MRSTTLPLGRHFGGGHVAPARRQDHAPAQPRMRGAGQPPCTRTATSTPPSTAPVPLVVQRLRSGRGGEEGGGGHYACTREVAGAGARGRSAPYRQRSTRARRARRVPLPSCSRRIRFTLACRMLPRAHAPWAGLLCLRALHACRALSAAGSGAQADTAARVPCGLGKTGGRQCTQHKGGCVPRCLRIRMLLEALARRRVATASWYIATARC